MTQIPRDTSRDSTIALMRDPYGFISTRCRRYRSDVFETRLMLQKTICMMGREAAELFYDPQRFIRNGAPPGPVQKTLFGQGGVQGTDGETHRHRKAMFMSLMTPERVEALGRITAGWWSVYARRWASMDHIVLYDQVHEILTRAVCTWAGVPLEESRIAQRTEELTALFDAAGAVGLRHWWSRIERKRANAWIEQVIHQIRTGQLNPPEDTAAHVIAWHRDRAGQLLPPHIAAVELLNILRPVVAVSVYITFIAHALHQCPDCRRRIQAGEEDYEQLFVQEVRRFYPFFPAVAALVRHDFEWKGYHFPRGTRVMLDLHGTDHDPRIWDNPGAFVPERFRGRDQDPFGFIPQGGGDYYINHRCPGEAITIELMKVATRLLTRRMAYDVPPQDLRIDRTRLPALPRSRFVIRNVRLLSPVPHPV